MPRLTCALLAFALALAAYAQTPESRDVFDVASVNPSAPRSPGGLVTMGRAGGPGTTDPGQVRYLNLTLSDLIGWAYKGDDVRQIIGAIL